MNTASTSLKRRHRNGLFISLGLRTRAHADKILKSVYLLSLSPHQRDPLMPGERTILQAVSPSTKCRRPKQNDTPGFRRLRLCFMNMTPPARCCEAWPWCCFATPGLLCEGGLGIQTNQTTCAPLLTLQQA